MLQFNVPSVFFQQHERLKIIFSQPETYTKLEGLKERTPISGGDVDCIDWNSCGSSILVAHRKNILAMYDAEKRVSIRSWSGCSWTWVEHHPTDVNVAAAVTFDGKLKLLDTRSDTDTSIVMEADYGSDGKGLERFLNVTWHPHGRYLAVYSRAGVTQILDPRFHVHSRFSGESPPRHTFDFLKSVRTSNNEVYCLLWDKNPNASSHRLWLGCSGTPGRIWQFSDEYLLQCANNSTFSESDACQYATALTAHQDTVASLTASRDGRVILSSGADQFICVWSTTTNSCVHAVSVDSKILAAGVSHDSSLFAFASASDPAGLRVGGTFTHHIYGRAVRIPGNGVSHIAWHPKNHFLAATTTSSGRERTSSTAAVTSLLHIVSINEDRAAQDSHFDY